MTNKSKGAEFRKAFLKILDEYSAEPVSTAPLTEKDLTNRREPPPAEEDFVYRVLHKKPAASKASVRNQTCHCMLCWVKSNFAVKYECGNQSNAICSVCASEPRIM